MYNQSCDYFFTCTDHYLTTRTIININNLLIHQLSISHDIYLENKQNNFMFWYYS